MLSKWGPGLTWWLNVRKKVAKRVSRSLTSGKRRCSAQLNPVLGCCLSLMGRNRDLSSSTLRQASFLKHLYFRAKDGQNMLRMAE